MAAKFELVSKFQPAGDQPQAIAKLVAGLPRRPAAARRCSAPPAPARPSPPRNVIAQLGKPTLVLSHNKTLAAQLYKEFRGFFPHNAVHYFVSYYDYYQPEAYIPQRDIYIEKDALINENIDRLRLAATSALVSREDVIIVASVSCIYGLGSPSDYKRMMVRLAKGEIDRPRQAAAAARRHSVPAQRRRLRARQVPRPRRRDRSLAGLRGVRLAHRAVRRRGRRPGHHQPDSAARRCSRSTSCTSTRPSTSSRRRSASSRRSRASAGTGRAAGRSSSSEGKLLEAQRLAARTRFDMEMLLEVGHCPGIENYARWFSGRKPGEPPYTLSTSSPKISS